MSEKDVYYKRCFLNKPRVEQGAYIIANISKDSYGDKDYQAYRECFIKISDCNRIIELDFSVDSDKDSSNSIAKIDKLVEIFTQFKKELEKEVQMAKKERIKLKAANKKEELQRKKKKEKT